MSNGEDLPNAGRTRQARPQSSGPANRAWREKLDPLFVRVAELNKRVVTLVRSDSAEERREGYRLNTEELRPLLTVAHACYGHMKGKLKHNALTQALGLENPSPGTEISQAEYVRNFLCWFRYRTPYPELLRQYEAGNLKAVKQMNQLRLELDLWTLGKVDPNRLTFKTDMDHFTLLTSGFDLGTENLSGDELADFFNEVCPCGREHFPESLTKLRTRILDEFPPEQTSEEESK